MLRGTIAWALSVWLLLASSAIAGEKSQAFLDGLRDRQLYDVALDYLSWARNSPNVSAEFKETIDYQRAKFLIAAAGTSDQPAARASQLDEAETSLRTFLKNSPQHPLATSAQSELGNVLVGRARLKVGQALKVGRSPAERKAVLAEARKAYQEARGSIDETEKQLEATYQKLKNVDPTDAKAVAERDTARREMLSAKLSAAQVLYEIAQTYDRGTAESKAALADAARRYNQLYDKYKPYLIAFYARLGEARCYLDSGAGSKAIAALSEPLEQPDDAEPFALMKNQATALAVEATAAGGDVRQPAEALNKAKQWLAASVHAEDFTPAGLAVRFWGGLSALEIARPLPAQDAKKAELLATARTWLEAVARRSGELQPRAQKLLAEPLLASKASAKAAATFEDAQRQGQEALERMQTAEAAAQGLKGAEQAKKLAEAAEARQQALAAFSQATRLVRKDVPVEERTKARYFLTYLFWASDRLYEAAMLGEHLAFRQPKQAAARPAARIAMAAYHRLYTTARPGDDRGFELSHMLKLADHITRQWPDATEADEAWMLLLKTAISAHEVDKALGYVARINPQSPQRPEALLIAGQALLTAYERATQQPADTRPAPDVLRKQLAQAQAMLAEGIEAMRKPVDAGEEVGLTLLAGTNALAQLLVATGSSAAAIGLMEDPKIGPVALADRKAPVVAQNNAGIEIYRNALRAYVGAGQLDKAEQTINKLEQLVAQAGDAEASRRLTQVYLSLGRELQDQIAGLRSQQKPEQLEQVTKGFEAFLARIAARDTGSTYQSLNWLAETFSGLAAGFDPGSGKLSPEAEKYYRKAIESYGRILKQAAADPKFAPAETLTACRVRLAQALRRTGEFRQALDLLCQVLRERNKMAEAQKEAAYTYQAWGEAQPSYYQAAIVGGQPEKGADGKVANLIWGWGKLSKLLAASPAHVSLFHEARYNLIVCRMKLALSQPGAQRAETLAQAQQDVVITEKLYPDLGGREWRDRYDALLKRIQQLRGLPPTGVQGLRPTT